MKKGFMLPEVEVCPGLPETVPYVYKGQEGKKMGSRIRGSMLVGYASWLGQFYAYYEDPDTGASFGSKNGGHNGRWSSINPNNPSANRPLRMMDLKNPSYDIILSDLLLQSTYNGKWTVPHGSIGNVMGVNQAYADGSDRWFNAAKLNTGYVPAYNWERNVILPFHRNKDVGGKDHTFNYGGYPYKKGYGATTLDWYGFSTNKCIGNYSLF